MREDHVVVAGQRGYNDKVDKDGNRTLEMNASQSFREKIPLSHPVAHNSVIREQKDGWLEVTIPKLKFGGKVKT